MGEAVTGVNKDVTGGREAVTGEKDGYHNDSSWSPLSGSHSCQLDAGRVSILARQLSKWQSGGETVRCSSGA